MARLVKPEHANRPWLAIVEFSSFADAKAFQELLFTEFGDKAIIRQKTKYFNQGNFADWRTTTLIRETFQGRSFNVEMLAETFANAGYSASRASISAWLGKAKIAGLLEKLAPRTYQFLPLPTTQGESEGESEVIGASA